jgi:hypothetical protein
MGMPASASGGWLALCAAAIFAAEVALAQAPQPQPAPPQPQFVPTQPSAQGAPQTQPSQPQAEQTPQPPAAPAKREGFFDAIERWWDKSTRDFKASVDENNAKWKQSVDDTNAKLKAGVDESNAKWRELGRKTEQATKDAAAAQKEATEEFLKAQKEAAEAFKNLSNLRMVEGRQICENAPNGSPDCQAAAEVICKGKGFATGKSADITTSRKCSARALLQRDESECRTETVVIKAACQ